MKIEGLPGVIDVAEEQRQSNPSPGQDQSVNPAHQWRVMQQQFVSQCLQFRPQSQGPGKVFPGQRETLDGDKVQGSCMGWRAALPGLPGCQKVQSGPEAVFGNNETPALGNLRETLR